MAAPCAPTAEPPTEVTSRTPPMEDECNWEIWSMALGRIVVWFKLGIAERGEKRVEWRHRVAALRHMVVR